jgi:hypothetical protein
MNYEINSTNPVVKAIISGTAPRPAQLAAARGILPLPQSDLLEILVTLVQNTDPELADNARSTLAAQDKGELETIVKSSDTAPRVLAYFAESDDQPKTVHEAILANPKTPDKAIINFARHTSNGELLEFIALNQQLLIGTPQILDAIINNPYRTAEAERRAAEIRREFFQKERGAEQIANELRARGKEAAAEFIESADFGAQLQETSFNIEFKF